MGCAPASGPAATPAGATSKRWFGSTTPPAQNVLRFNLGAEPEYIDPGLAVGQPDGRVCRLLFEGVTREDAETLEPRPGQAYRWDVSADRLTYTFHLRPGLEWSDGTPITARDFRWSWLRVLDPRTASRYAGVFAPIRNATAFNDSTITDPNQVGIAAPDDSTLVVQLQAPTAYFLYLTQFYTALPVPQHAVEKFGDRWTLPQNMVNNGAFRLSYWRQNSRFEFVRNPRYWDAAHVKLDGIVGYTLDDLNTSANLYKAGVIDWAPSGYIPSPFVPYLRQFADYRHGPYQGVYFYSINVTRKPFDNVWVRRALNYAVDRDAIANDLLKRSRDPWGRFAPSGYPGYDPPAPITFDPERARECLAKAGYPGGKGFPKFEITFNTSEDHRRIAEAIQQMWRRELNVDVQLSNQEWGVVPQGHDQPAVRRGAAVVDRRLPGPQHVPVLLPHRRRQQPQRLGRPALRPDARRRRARAGRGQAVRDPAPCRGAAAVGRPGDPGLPLLDERDGQALRARHLPHAARHPSAHLRRDRPQLEPRLGAGRGARRVRDAALTNPRP